MNDRPRILVVDDDAPLRLLLALVLEEAGYEPTIVACVDRALERLAADEYDVVLTDLAMPGRSGLELLAALRVAVPRLPAVAMTGSDEEMRRRARALGARAVLAKPLDADTLAGSLAGVLAGALSEAA